jgi:hypothetical protein
LLIGKETIMKRPLAPILFACFLALCSCSNQDGGESNAMPGEQPESDITIDEATVAEFQVNPPRSILFSEPVGGYSQVWFDEAPAGDGFEVNTVTYSRNGCPLAGPPIQAGDSIKVVGHLDSESRLVADVIWVLGIVADAPECEGPPAD